MRSQAFGIKVLPILVTLFTLFWAEMVVATTAQLSSMRVGQTADKTRVVFDLKQADDYKVFQLNNPSRLVVDFLNTQNALSFKNKHLTDKRLFKIRVSDNKKRVRVVLDLHKNPSYKVFMLGQNSKTKQRLVLDLLDKKATKTVVKAEQKTPVNEKSSQSRLAKKQSAVDVKAAKAVESKQTKTVPNKKTEPLIALAKSPNVKALPKSKATDSLLNQESAVFKKPAKFVIAIDPGHGGKDTGAVGHNKVYEKFATLNMAKELKRIIDRQPGMKAVLTRNKDVFIPLSERVKIAKKKQADLFISIHADAFHDDSVRGGSVYILSERGASSTMARLLAKSENAALQDVSLKGMDDDVAFALSDLSREANVKASRQLASIVLGEMHKKVKMHKHSVQSAGFAVLKSIDMPSLLIETAFISNPHEARNLMSRKFQRKMASAIVDGLNKYVEQTAPKERWGETLYVQYKVQYGDTLSQIAAQYEVSTKTLKKVNNIRNANQLYVGKKLKIPVSGKLVAGL